MNIKMEDRIHRTAIIDESVRLHESVEVGPYSIIRGNVSIGANTVVKERVTIEGNTTLGKNNIVFAGAIIGSETQDKKFDGGSTFVRIGNGNVIREYVTINPGTENGSETVIGNNNLFMAYSHIAHDCRIHDNVTLANVATLAGHVEVESRAIIGGLSAVHQFVRIGRSVIVGGCSKVVQDVPPFMMADGHPVKAYGINSVGLSRLGVSSEEKSALKKAFKILFRSGLTAKNAIAQIQSLQGSYESIAALTLFLKNSKRGICS